MNDFPNPRCWEIVNILLNSMKPLTINEVANKLNVSNRTIRNDLKEIENYFKLNNYGRIIKKPRIGIWLEVNQQKRLIIKNTIYKSKGYIQPFSVEDRRLYIIKRLLLSDETITIQLLADELYVSKVTIYKDLEEVENWLTRYDLSLNRKQNYGIEIVGDEKSWRKAAADLLVQLKNSEEIKNMLLKEQETSFGVREDYSNNIHIERLLPDIDIGKIQGILNEAVIKLRFFITDESLASLLIHIAISIQRIRQNKDIKICSNQLSGIIKHKEYEIACWIADRVKREFSIDLPESEIGYICLHILGSRIQKSFYSSEVKSILSNTDGNILRFAREIVTLIGNILSVDFSEDEKLLTGLVLHLRPAINRLKFGLSLRNPLLEEIKSKYPSVFGATWATSVLFEKYFGIKVTEEEIGYIAIHIGAALERQDSKTRAIIVCSSGIGTAQLVAVRLEREIRGLKIVDITSVHEINKVKPTDFDIIISTIPFKYISKPTVQISVFVTESDIKRIKEYIKNIENTRRFSKELLELKENGIFNKDLIISKIEADSKEEVIEKLGEILVNKGYVEKDFIKTVIDREKITSTAVGKGVAIPHGQQIYVRIPSIAVATLQSPVDWSCEKVDIVFLLALKFETGNEIRKFFKKFYSMLDNSEILSLLRNMETSEDIYNVLTRENLDYEQFSN